MVSGTADPRWTLSVGGHPAPGRPAFGWATAFAVPGTGGAAVLRYHTPARRYLELGGEALLWLLALAVVVLGRRRRRPPDGARWGARATTPRPTWRWPEPCGSRCWPASAAATSARRSRPASTPTRTGRGEAGHQTVSDIPDPMTPGRPDGEVRSAPRGRHGRRTPPRLPVIVALVGLLVAGILVDRANGPTPVAAEPAVGTMPAAAPSSALSSSWFCAGPADQPAGTALGNLVLANATGQARHASVILTGATGPVKTMPVAVAPYSRVSVAEQAGGHLPYTGAVVDVDGGGVAVEQTIGGTLGLSTAACASAGSDRWYFADGTTQESASLLLSLLNPYPEDAIVDLSFVTEQGVEAPDEFQGIVVPARSLVGVDVGSRLRRRAQVATTVSARTGRVVAWKTQVVGPPPSAAGSAPPATPPAASGPAPAAGPAAPRVPGVALVLGAPSPGTTWWWPDGVASNGVTERYRIYNPGDGEADVSLAVLLDQGSADPFTLKVEPHATVTVDAGAESRIPQGVAHAAVLRSTNGVGVVGERTVDAVAPSPHPGVLDLLGARVPARRWVFATGSAVPHLDEWLAIYNPGPASTDLSVAALTGNGITDLPGLSGLTLPAGRRLAIHINQHAAGLDRSLLVDAHADVVVERDLYPSKGLGLDGAIGVPLGP